MKQGISCARGNIYLTVKFREQRSLLLFEIVDSCYSSEGMGGGKGYRLRLESRQMVFPAPVSHLLDVCLGKSLPCL